MRWYIRGLFLLGGFLLVTGLWMRLTGRELRVNVTVSLPPGLYICQAIGATQPLKRGNIVRLLPPDAIRATYATLAPGEPQAAYWMKQVVATAGSTVCLHGDDVTVQGDVIAHRPLLGSTPLTSVEGCWLLGPDDVFVGGSHARSFDARYTGPWHRDTIHGICRPVLTWKATP